MRLSNSQARSDRPLVGLHLLPLPCLPREPELRLLRKQSGFRKSGISVFGGAVPPNSFPKTG